MVSALSGLLDSARSGCPLLAGDEWSFSLLFGFWLCCRGFLWPCVCCLLLFPLVVWFCFVVLCSGLTPRGLFSPCPALPLLCPPPWLVLWCMLVQSVFCWSLPLWVTGCICDGPVVMPCMVCCDGLVSFFTSLHGNKGFRALCGAPPSTPCCGCCFGAFPSCTEGFTLGDPASPPGRR